MSDELTRRLEKMDDCLDELLRRIDIMEQMLKRMTASPSEREALQRIAGKEYIHR
jgi:hypothetical protein